MPNDIAVARYIPPVSVPDMERMARAIVESGLFGVRTVPQALTLMWLAQAEGRHPVLAARDYHIIEGKPSKTAEAMMRDFLSARGTVEWHELSDAVADATFSHPHGGEVRIHWDMERARKAGLLGRKGDMWGKYPRQMLRSRVVSEGIRTVGPMATSGLYVPEEVGDYEPRRPRGMKDVTPPPEDPPASPEIVDQFTGEIIDRDQIERDAREAALRGTELLRSHLRAVTPEVRELLREAVGTGDEPGPLLTAARLADADAVRERLRTPANTPAPPAPAVDPAQGEGDFARGIPPATAAPRTARRTAAEPQGQGDLARAGHYRSEQGSDLEPPPRSAIWGETAFSVPLTDRNGGPDWEKWAADLVFLAEEATAAELDKLKADNKAVLQRLKVSDATRYRSLMHDLDSGRHNSGE